MSFFIGNSIISQKFLDDMQTAINNANTAASNANTARNNANAAANNANQKIADLDNFDFEMVKMGNYKIDNNEVDDTLDFTYEGNK